MVKVIANSIRIGNVIEHQNRLWRVIKIDHTKPGKGGAFNQMELQALEGATKLNERFRATEKIDQVTLEQKTYQFLFLDGDDVTVMDAQTFEQETFNKSLFGDSADFLQDEMDVVLESHDGRPLSAVLPEKVILEIVETEPVVKGQTAASSNKPAILDNGVRVMVPPFINQGDKVVVRIIDRSYVERAKG